MAEDDILREQLAYYRARAQEYDESVKHTGRFAGQEAPGPQIEYEWAQVVRALHAFGAVDHGLELACGTGLWTKNLVPICRKLTALDGSPEMLTLNRANVADARVRYVSADLFAWEPEAEYDLVFFAFWLSHVPEEALGGFFEKVKRAVRPGGRVFIVDEPAGGRQLSGPVQDGQYQTRAIHDGRTFRIIKVYYEPEAVQARLQRLGFEEVEFRSGDYCFYLTGKRRA